MNPRILACVAIAFCGALVLVQHWLLGSDYENPWFVWIPLLLILGWSMWQLRERPDPDEPAFDFNPKRGLLFFALGFLVFPITLGLRATLGVGGDISMPGLALATLAGSVFVGLVGSFTRHVGV